MSRLPVQPGERIDRGAPVSFTWDGKPVSGYAGDTIASALYASGTRVFSRSFKYHRPRGEFCFCGACANSLVTVDGKPGVRACGEPITPGMRVEHQNAWPSLDFDVMAATDRFGGKLLPPGFYYKTFIRPRKLWPVYEGVPSTVLREVFARCVAALGSGAEGPPTTPRDLWEVRIAERKAREKVIAQCKDAVDAGREVTLVYRARSRPAEPMRMVLTAIDLGLDPPRVIGYQLPGRGRRELRADRILRIETTDQDRT